MGNISISVVTVTDGIDSITEGIDEGEPKIALAGGDRFDYIFSSKAGVWVEGRFSTVNRKGSAVSYIPIRAGVKLLLGK